MKGCEGGLFFWGGRKEVITPKTIHAPTLPQITPCFGDDGAYADWDVVDALWEHAFT